MTATVRINGDVAPFGDAHDLLPTTILRPLAASEQVGKGQLVTIDPKVLTGPKGLVARRLATYGVAVRSEGALVPAAGTAAAPKAPAPKTLTAEDLVKNRRAKRAAASASPGAGSPVASLAKAPAYDPKQKGSPIEQAAAWGKAQLRRMTTRPQ